MTPRRRALILVGLAVLLLAIVIAAILLILRLLPDPAPQAPASDRTATATPEVVTSVDFVNPLIADPVAVQGSAAARQMAELFAERYGSYSNQGNYQNLRDLLPVMTAAFRARTEATLAAAAPASGTFEGVTSVKVSTDVRSADEDSAVVAVTLQQEKTSGGAAPTVGYRTLRMELVREGESWRVDAAAWDGR